METRVINLELRFDAAKWAFAGGTCSQYKPSIHPPLLVSFLPNLPRQQQDRPSSKRDCQEDEEAEL
jgi:hypothetical protein